MGDTPRTDEAQQHAVYDGYSKLMQSPCAGHALFEPTNEELALGDGGYLDRGKFVKEFNIYEQSQIVRTPAPEHKKERITDALWSRHMPLVSSHHTVVTGELSVETGDKIVAPIQVNPTVNLKDDEYAMLHAYAPKREDYMKRGEKESVREWLLDNRALLRSKTIVLTRVVRASGWVALYSSVRQQSGSLGLGFGSQFLGVFGKGSLERADAKKVVTKGPEHWTVDDNADYAVIVSYARRLEYIRHAAKSLIWTPSQGGVSNGPDTTNAAAGQAGANALANAPSASSSTASFSTAMTSYSLAFGEETDMDLLYPFLAVALEKRQDLAAVAADTSIIFDFLHKYKRLPDPITDALVIESREGGGSTAERVGWISQVDVLNDGDHTAVINSENSITKYPRHVVDATVESVNLAEAAPVPSASDRVSRAPVAVGAIGSSQVRVAMQFAQNINHPPRPVGPSQSSSGMGSSVQALNNHYQANGLLPSQYVTYSKAIPLGRDQVAISIFLKNYDPPLRFDGNATGKRDAKEAAAREALKYLGVI